MALDGTEQLKVIFNAVTGREYASARELAGGPFRITQQTVTAYTFVYDDSGKYIQFTSGSSVAATVPPNSSLAVAFPIGAVLTLEQNGAGTVTPTAGAGVTINSAGGATHTNAQYAVVSLIQVSANVWTMFGNMA